MTTDLTCQDLMHNENEQIVLRPDDTVSKAFQLMRKKGMRFLPVVEENGQYVGVFTSPTLIRLMLPRAVTLGLGSKNSNQVIGLNFYNLDKDSFTESLQEVKNDLVKNHLSDPKNIPVTAPNTPIMEGILLLHKYKRHVILVDPDSNQFVGVLSINAALRNIFEEDVEL